jgi:PAS domain S-box-containing protein
LGYSLEQHEQQPELRNRFIPDERIKLILENASTGNDLIKRRIKISFENEVNRWVEAVYIPSFEYKKKYKTILVILRDVTDEEINKVLQKAVNDIARMTSNSFSLNRIFTIIHKIISDLINIDNFYIALFDEEKGEVSFPYFVDTADNTPPKPRRNGHGLTEYVLRSGKTLLCQPHCFDELLYKNEIEIVGTKPKVWLGVPLKFHGKVLGVLAVQHYSNTDAFGESEQYILEYFSEQVARTIDFKRKADTVKLLSIAVEQSPVSVVITTLKPEIVYVNSAFTRVTGYEPSEALGKNPRFLQSGQTPKERYVELWDTITTGKTWSGEFVNKRKSGEIFYEESIIVPITDEFGKNAYYLSIKIDTTEKKKLINDLIAAKEKAEESDRLKTAFLQNISHEIRTPMNAIVGFAEILETDHDDEEKISYYTSVIKQRSYDLLDIVNELLDISRIESGQLNAEIKPFVLKEIFEDLQQIFEGFKTRMERQEIALKPLPLPANVARVISGDEAKLRQVFVNLIHNALKFTHEGYVEYGFHELSNGDIVFRVTDTGIGIPTDMQDKIFERFQKSSPKGAIYDGLGLGLTIVRSLVNLLNGKIWLESEVGKGTTFYFSIPYLPQMEETLVEQVAVNPQAIQQFNLLVVEDDTYNVAYFNELFGSLGVNYHIESTGTDAIDHFRNNQNYDMVLMDIKLPDMTGYEAIEEFKRINPNVPIIAQTAYAAESDKQKALQVGCIDYISKPIFRDKLIGMLQKHLVKG